MSQYCSDKRRRQPTTPGTPPPPTGREASKMTIRFLRRPPAAPGTLPRRMYLREMSQKWLLVSFAASLRPLVPRPAYISMLEFLVPARIQNSPFLYIHKTVSLKMYDSRPARSVYAPAIWRLLHISRLVYDEKTTGLCFDYYNEVRRSFYAPINIPTSLRGNVVESTFVYPSCGRSSSTQL